MENVFHWTFSAIHIQTALMDLTKTRLICVECLWRSDWLREMGPPREGLRSDIKAFGALFVMIILVKRKELLFVGCLVLKVQYQLYFPYYVLYNILYFIGRAVIHSQAAFNPGKGPIWIQNIVCTGAERSLEECKAPSWQPTYQCKHLEDVGVECIPFRQTTLTNNTSNQGNGGDG